MVRVKRSAVKLPLELIDRLKARQRSHQAIAGVIEELLAENEISPETMARLKDYRNGNESTDQTVKGVLDELDRLTNGVKK